ncbi:hypothetical protein EK904_004630 [Melospiza melodia maxima]|nr:hypothetical protein EK904_004630 [Melospiza melodia maxima]
MLLYLLLHKPAESLTASVSAQSFQQNPERLSRTPGAIVHTQGGCAGRGQCCELRQHTCGSSACPGSRTPKKVTVIFTHDLCHSCFVVQVLGSGMLAAWELLPRTGEHSRGCYVAVVGSGSHPLAAGHPHCPGSAFPGANSASPAGNAIPESSTSSQTPVAMAADFMPAVFQNMSN